MANTGPKNKKKGSIPAGSLKEAEQRLHQLERQNQELIGELESLRAQIHKTSVPEKSSSSEANQPKRHDKYNSPDIGLLRCIIDTVAELIYVKDRDGVYRACNKESERFVGLSEAEQIGKTDFDFFPPEVAKTIQETDRQIIDSGLEHCGEEWVPDPDGKMILLETQKTPFYGPDGKVAGIVGVSRNITARKQAEEALKKANRELADFAHTVAHDLRTPLTPIIGYAEILRNKHQGQLDELALVYLDEIISSGEEMQLLMKDLLTLAVAGKIEPPSRALDAGEIVKGLVNSLAEQLAQAGVTVILGELPSLRVPKTLLYQVFENLILNAMRYGATPGDKIEIGGARIDDRVKFYVRDHGPGIPSDEREAIFEVFSRGSTAGETEGTGIGLATVRKIAELFDGHAWIEDTPGGGSTFWIEISDLSITQAPAEKTR